MERSAEQEVPCAAAPSEPEAAADPFASTTSGPRRRFGIREHLSAFAAIAFSLLSGLLALSGHPWWAILPASASIIVASAWTSARKRHAAAPLPGAVTLVAAVFGAWLFLPLYRGICHGETVPFPELLNLGGLAPAAWLLFYTWMLLRRRR